MSKHKNNFNNPYTEKVTLEPVKCGGIEVEKVSVMVEDDAGVKHLAGILGKNYNLIKNSMVKDTTDDIMTRSGYSWRNIKTLWDGKRLADYYITDQEITTIKNGQAYPIHLGLMARNSYDGSSAYGIELFACNMVCTNQYVSRNRFGYFQVYHNDRQAYLIDDAVQMVSQGAQRVLEIAPRFEDMMSREFTHDMIVKAKEKTAVPHSKWGDVLDQMAVENATLFGLYQALTFVTSHKMSGFNSISAGDSVTDFALGSDFI